MGSKEYLHDGGVSARLKRESALYFGGHSKRPCLGTLLSLRTRQSMYSSRQNFLNRDLGTLKRYLSRAINVKMPHIMTVKYIPLHLHTEYSILDGMVRIPQLLDAAIVREFPAIAITEQMNLFSTVKFYRDAVEAGIKPIIGAELWIENQAHPDRPFNLVALCQNQKGYKNLIQLISRAYIENQQRGKAIVKRDWLPLYADGLLILSGGLTGDIGQAILADKKDVVQALLKSYQQIYPDRFYLELQRIGLPQEETYIRDALDLSKRYQVPVVATNNVRFLNRDDFEAHEARVCIHGGWQLNDTHRPRDYTEQQYLRTADEMVELFSDIPAAIQNTVEIAKRCNFQLILGKVFLPNFPVPEQGLSLDEYFQKVSRIGLEARLRVILDPTSDQFESKRRPYDERLAYELQVIQQMGFTGYFLIVADFIQWSKNNGVPVGPGRGSGAGSLVAYALNITDLDPLQFDLLFERFLNPERISMPDFDIDFCMEGRDRVIDYVAHKYGRQSVSQIITYGTMAAKAVVRDVGRVLGHNYGFVDKIAKLIPFELGMTLDHALESEPLLRQRYEEEEEVHLLIDLAKKLEGVTRNAGKHAGGVVIAPTLLTDFTPLYCEADGASLMTQFDKDDVEAIGLVKFDFLGLRTLTIINWAVQAINQKRIKTQLSPIDISLIPLDDAKTFQLLKACRTTAVFQLESRGMKDLVKRLRPDHFEEIIALVALFRPGPLQSGMVEDFISRKHGRARVEYLHDALKPILKTTYGVILYQEQVMQIARVLAGYTLGQADLLRKAMGKKKAEVMAEQRATFVEGAAKNNIREDIATNIFNLMEKFAGYGFNKSHSAAYALIAYQTAWLKTHYPAEFMAAVLSADMNNTDKVVNFIEECLAMGLTVLPPCINHSRYQFFVQDGNIIYGLGAIKGVGESAIESILGLREAGGPFQNLFDFCQRVDLRKVNKRVMEALIKSGSFDEWGVHRAALCATTEEATKAAEQHLQNHSQGQQDLFGGVIESSEHYTPTYIDCAEWSRKLILTSEKETLGWYLSGHPIEMYEKELPYMVTAPIGQLHLSSTSVVTLGGLIADIRIVNTKRGDRMAIVTLYDRTGRIEVVVFSDVFESARKLLMSDQVLIVEGEVSVDDFSGGYRISARKLFSIEKMREIYAKYLLITIDSNTVEKGFAEKLTQVIKPFVDGDCPICLAYQQKQARALLPLGQEWRVTPSDELLERLREFFPASVVEMVYV